MSQRVSGFDRVPNDLYQTPAWVLHALAEHVEFKGKGIWEPACGEGRLATAIVEAGAAYAHCTDIVNHGCPQFGGELDFTTEASSSLTHYDGIVTNPPYGERAKLAEAFIEGGLRRTRDYGFLALLLPVDFDSAKTRARFFNDCPRFAGKVTLTKRIKWFRRRLKRHAERQPRMVPLAANMDWRKTDPAHHVCATQPATGELRWLEASAVNQTDSTPPTH